MTAFAGIFVQPDDSPAATPALFFQFVDDGGGTDVQDAGGVADPAGIHGHVDDLLLHRRGLACVGIGEEKGQSTPLEAGTAPMSLLAFRRQTMLGNLESLAMGA